MFIKDLLNVDTKVSIERYSRAKGTQLVQITVYETLAIIKKAYGDEGEYKISLKRLDAARKSLEENGFWKYETINFQ
jgi:hypothetical protein